MQSDEERPQEEQQELLHHAFAEKAAWDEEDEFADTMWDRESKAASAINKAQLPAHTSRNVLQAHMALLDNTLVSLHGDADAYRLVRTHFAVLEQWHEQHTGWRIQHGSSFFRLERHLHTITPVFLDDKLKRARDFVCLTWLLWFAENRYLAGGGRNQQFLLSQLADELQKQSKDAGGSDGSELDFRSQQDRYSMWRALDYLTRLGGLQTLEGEIKKWAEDATQSDNEVLYEFTPVTHSLIEALSEQRVAAIATLLAAHGNQLLLPDTLSPQALELPPLVRAWRTLLLGPVLFRYDDPRAFSALTSHAEQVSEELSDVFGWLLELNSDYACIVRGGSLSAGAGPTLTVSGAHDQMILLLCTAFRQQVEQEIWTPDAYGFLHVTQWDILSLFSELRQRYGSYWGTTVKDIKATELLEEIYGDMRLFGLLRGPDAAGNILIPPTAARYSVSYGQEPPPAREKTPARARKTTTRTATQQQTLDYME